ncbi:hypothetical protein B0A55_10094 [Friedmanniomyces simplex]|uniref:Uncharacterized protein n=1 Tax=Friedmanniomyces simplex TaxID=329884 RepID=A0A4U0WP70_9PEZI|nr:hypothetical protein B0A55_10094 [Friedmanniomyces simplex]
MPSDKDRIFIALYARNGQPKMPGLEDKYHWAIIVGPKIIVPESEGRRFHAREKMTPVDETIKWIWGFEECTTTMDPTQMILARVLIGKIANTKRLESVLRSTPVRAAKPGWNCVEWVKEALQGLNEDGKALGTSVMDWESVRDAAMGYVASKIAQHRFDRKGTFDMLKVATWDLLEGKESIP